VVELNLDAFDALTKTEIGGQAFYPHKTKGEGLYCCVLRKKNEVASNDSVRKQKMHFEKFDRKKYSLDGFVKNPAQFSFLDLNGRIIGFPEEKLKEFTTVSSVTKVIGGYLAIGEIKGKDLIPDHSLSMSVCLEQPFPIISLSNDEALLYLSRKDLKLESEHTGWCTIKFQDQPLGFIKKLSNRINNYYPVEWRIRMDV